MKCKLNNSFYKPRIVLQPTWMTSSGFCKALCWWCLINLLGYGRENESGYDNLMCLRLEQSSEIQRKMQAPFFKRMVSIVFQQTVSFYLTVDFYEGVLFQIFYFVWWSLHIVPSAFILAHFPLASIPWKCLPWLKVKCASWRPSACITNSFWDLLDM